MEAFLQLNGASEAASWADAFQQQQQQSPAEQRKARGASADDPLEDPTASSWVAQFNEQLHLTTTNAAQGLTTFSQTLPGNLPALSSCVCLQEGTALEGFASTCGC